MMKASVAFMFFLLFLAGIAFVNLRAMRGQSDNSVTPQEDLVSSAWRPVRLGEMKLPDDTEMHVQFEAGGRIGGHGGCNRFFGHFEIVNEELTIGPLGGTRMACPEPANSFEISFFEALQSAATIASTGDYLAIRNAQGDTVVRFVEIDRKDDN